MLQYASIYYMYVTVCKYLLYVCYSMKYLLYVCYSMQVSIICMLQYEVSIICMLQYEVSIICLLQYVSIYYMYVTVCKYLLYVCYSM